MLHDNNHDILLKIVVKGNSLIGKTSIINSYITEQMWHHYNCNICVDFQYKIFQKYDKKIKLKIWDPYGINRFCRLQNHEIKDIQGLVLVYDITNRNSFESVKEYLDPFIQQRETQYCIFILVGNKCDLDMQRAVSYYEGQLLADSLGIKFFEISAKSLLNINSCFEELTNQILQRL